MKNLIQTTYGTFLCILIGIISLFLSSYISIGTAALAIILGIAAGNTIKPGERFKKGIAFSEGRVLSFAIALMGVDLNFFVLRQPGYKSILIIITAIAFTLFSAVALARIFHFDKKFTLLLGIGNGICGSSAIAATKGIIGGKEEDAGLSIAIVNCLGTLGIFLLPFIASVVFEFSDTNAGIFIGNTLQAVGQVVASGFSISEKAGQTATIIKMTRILMLTPVIILLIFMFSKENTGSGSKEKTKRHRIPYFIIGFFLFSLIPTFGLLPEEYIKVISTISHGSLIVAMAGIGLKITFDSIIKNGKSAFLIGSLIFLLQIIFSGGMIYLFF